MNLSTLPTTLAHADPGSSLSMLFVGILGGILISEALRNFGRLAAVARRLI